MFRIGPLIAALSAAYSAAMFRGLENHPGYYGSAWQALYPNAFPGDPFMPAGRPIMLTLYYLLVRWVGPLWLDDRFTLLIFFGMTALSLVALDKTVRLLGCTLFWERAALLAFVLLEHKFYITHVLLVDNYGFNATALGGAVALWLLYGALAGWGAIPQLSLAILGMGFSPKNCWLPALIAGVLFWKDRLGRRGKLLSLLTVIGVAAGGLAFYYAYLRPGDGSHVLLFNDILHLGETEESNPFLYPLWCNLFFAGFCLMGFLPLGLPAEATHRIRVVAGIGLLAWFLGGIYLSHAPDALKIPYLVPFALRRALRWPAYVLFVAFGAALLKRFQKTPSPLAAWASGLAFLALYLLLHLEPRWNLAGLLAGATLAMLLVHFMRHPVPDTGRGGRYSRWTAAERLKVIAAPVVLGTISLYAIGAMHHRLPALRHLLRHGIVGDNPTAKWTGINEYVRRETLPSAKILAFSMEDTQRQPAPLRFDDSLRSRTGRSMPLGHRAAFYVDYAGLLWWDQRNLEMEELLQAWEREDLPVVSERLRRMGPLEILVIPTEKSRWAEASSGFGYRLETRIGEFTIFRAVRNERGT